MPICPNCSEQNPERARFCLVCGSALAGAEHQSPEVRKTVTVLFCDMAGSTSLGDQQDPEHLRGVMSRYYEEARTVLERHGGSVEKFIGDAVMAVFGIPVLHEDDPVRAARAAVDLRDAIAALNAELERSLGVTIGIRVGVNTGEVIAGDQSHGHSFVAGDAVNVAQRLESSASAGEILIGEDTYRLVRDAVVAEALEPLDLKGKRDRVAAYRLLRVTPRAAGHARRLDSPMVGRERESDLLHEAFERAVDRRASELVTVIGPAGIGKSRLVAEALRDIGQRAMVLTGGCLPYGEGITFWPVLEVVKQATGITEEDSPERARAKIVTALMGDDSAELAAERVAELLGLVEAGAAVEEGFWGVRKLLEALGLRRPLVVVFDDANWAEPTLLDLIEYLSDWSREAPILLVCMARQELLEMRPGWGAGTANATTIALEPLSRSESDLLIENLLGRAELAEEVRARIREAAEGNPLFVEEMLEMLIDGGLLRRDDGRWIPTGDLSRVPVPPTIQALLASRLDQLDPAERHVIERAAVEGKTFHRGSVRALTDGDARERVGAHLLALARKGLVRPSAASFAGEDAFRFRHVLIREAAYESLPKRVRANLHDRFASWLEEVAGERVAEYEELLGYHLEQAFRYRTELSRVDEWAEAVAARGGSRLASAGRRALTRGDVPAAVNLLERAVSLLGEAEGCPPDVLLYLGAALHEAGELARADAVLGEAVATAERAGEAVAAERARIERSALRFYLDPAYDEEEAVRVAQKAIGVFTQAGDEVGLAEAWRHLAYPKWNACRLAEMEEMLAEALVHAERAGDERARDDILNSLCRVAIISPTPVERGIQRCRDTLDGAGRELAAVAEVALGVLVAMQGGFAEARERVARSHAALEELGHGLKLAAGSMYTAYIELLADNVSAAEHELRRGYHAFDRMGERSQLSSTAALLGFALEKQGLVDEADEYIAVSRDTASAQDRASQVLWRIAGARILLRRGRSQEAGELARRAVELAQKTDFLDLEGHAHATLGGILRAQDRLDEAHARLERAASLHDRKGNAVLAGRVRTKLAELSVARLA